MTAQEDIKTPFNDHHWELHKAITQAHEFDFRLAYDLDRQLKGSAELRDRFEKDPKGTAKELVGLELPEGFHIHYINESNEYIPRSNDPIADPQAQLQAGEGGKVWGRVEVRTAVGPGAIAISLGIPDPAGEMPGVASFAAIGIPDPAGFAAIGIPDPAGTTPPTPTD